LDLSAATRTSRPVQLPELEAGQGVRVIVTLHDQLMRAYSTPIVETVPLTAEDQKLLDYSTRPRTVEAASLEAWLSQIYPPGIMERTNPRTKEAYRIESVEGTLTLAAAGSGSKYRFMTLSGKIRLRDEGEDDFSFDGNLAIVLTYKKGSSRFYALRGVFEGNYPRFDRMHESTRNIPLTAVFESLNTES
jgi:hypothetical protein